METVRLAHRGSRIMSSLIPSILGLAVLVLAASSAQGLSMPHNLWYDYWGQVKVTDRLACR